MLVAKGQRIIIRYKVTHASLNLSLSDAAAHYFVAASCTTHQQENHSGGSFR